MSAHCVSVKVVRIKAVSHLATLNHSVHTFGILKRQKALIGYVVIQNIEGNVLVPMIQQKAVHLAPALLISVQVLLSIVFGVVGLMLAAPLTIVAMVAVQKIWVEHTLGEKIT